MPNSPFSIKTKVKIIQEGNIKTHLDRLYQDGVFHCSVADFRERIWEACKDGLEGEAFRTADNLPELFVGFIAMDEHLIISLPKVYDMEKVLGLSDIQQRNLCRRLFHFLKKYTQWSESKDRIAAKTINTFNQNLGNNNKKPASRLATAKTILDDFQENDVWTTNHRVYKKNARGATVWSRTIRKTQSVYSSSGVFYPNPIRSQRELHVYHRLRQVHHWVLLQIFRHFGWLLTDIQCPLPPIPKPASNLEMLQMARRQLRESFLDRDIRLWHAIVRYLDTDKRGNEQAIDVYGSCAFHVIFEEACRRVFEMKEYDDRYSQKFPTLNTTVKWNVRIDKTKEFTEFENSGNQADIILPIVENEEDDYIKVDLDGNRVFVLDAKYYDFERIVRESAPKTTTSASKQLIGAPSLKDVRKQYFYTCLTLSETKRQITEAKSAFVFPYVSNMSSFEDPCDVIHLGSVGFGLEENTFLQHNILLFGVCVEWLFSQYLELNKGSVRKNLYQMWNQGKSSLKRKEIINFPTPQTKSKN